MEYLILIILSALFILFTFLNSRIKTDNKIDCNKCNYCFIREDK